jgi:hypothetical protein
MSFPYINASCTLNLWDISKGNSCIASHDTVLFQLLDRIQLAEEENRAVLSAVVSRGSGAHAHNEEDMLSLVKAQLLRQQLLEEEQLFKHEGERDEAERTYTT